MLISPSSHYNVNSIQTLFNSVTTGTSNRPSLAQVICWLIAGSFGKLLMSDSAYARSPAVSCTKFAPIQTGGRGRAEFRSWISLSLKETSKFIL